MHNNLIKKIMSMLLVSSMVIGSASVLSGCGSKENEVIILDVYSQLANYSGRQTGWIADILKEKFNVKLNIISGGSDVCEKRMESGDLGDIIVWENDNDQYPDAVRDELLYDWNQEDLLGEFGPYIRENMQDALKRNQDLTSAITEGKSNTLYGFGNNVATSNRGHESFSYTWDIRWDIYKKIGYPKVNSLDDFRKLLKALVRNCSRDDLGNRTYAMSLWSDWDDDMVMCAAAMVSAFYGYDEMGLGFYDVKTGLYHDALKEDGPYLTMLKFLNHLYQDRLLDPDSITQTYNQMIEKVQNGGTMFSVVNYAGHMAYNKQEHTKDGKAMFPMKPKEARPLIYGMNANGGEQIWTIGAKTKYPELCMEIINYFSTPGGCMTMNYGPQGVTWNYDSERHAYFTEFGETCNKNKLTKMEEPYAGNFQDGSLQILNTTWSLNAYNPASNRETYNFENWKNNTTEAKSKIEKDWRKKTNANSVDEYFENTQEFVVIPATSLILSQKDDDLKIIWSQVTDEIKSSSWRAIYADSDEEYDKIVTNMINKCISYGYDECTQWSRNEASKRRKIEETITW